MNQMNFNNYRNGNGNNGYGLNIRGKHFNLDTSNISTAEIRQAAGIKQGRQIMVDTGDGMMTLDDRKRYDIPPQARFKDAPAVRKAASFSDSDYTYGEHQREDWCNEVIRQQIQDIERNFLRQNTIVDNVDNPVLLIVPQFHLPTAVQRLNNGLSSSPIALMLPDQYPAMPPVGFFLPASISAGKHSGFSTGYHGAYKKNITIDGVQYRWYCSSILADTWQPAQMRRISDWRNGDSLWQVFSLISEVLSDFSDD